MKPAADIREIVDAMFAAQKTLVGHGEWQPDREGVKRFVRTIECDGENVAEVTVKAYPRLPQPRFRIILAMGRALWRLDFTRDEVHVNPRQPNRKELDPPTGFIKVPHYHAWADNRRLATQGSLPQKLKFARILPDRIRSFDSAFRWFCAETNIEIGIDDVPLLPSRDTLL